MKNTLKLTEMMNTYWKEFSIMTCEERGIPNVIDGLKPVQRFLLLNGYKLAKTHFDKVASIGSSVSGLGYEHGEASANGALTIMGAYHSNNLCLFEGQGNFGSILTPDSYAAPRYIFAKLSPLIDLIFKDTDLAPVNPDPEILTPLYYLPILPLVLLNGVKGLATGYAVDIPPHSPISVIDNLIKLCDGKKITKIEPKYYFFTGEIERFADHYLLHAVYEKKSPIHFIVKDLPPIFNTSASYESFLRKLLEKGTITNYENNSCDDKFLFEVWIKRGTTWTDEQIVNNLKLTNKHNWNLTTIMPNGKLHVWDKETGIEDILTYFYDFRIPFIQTRIDNKRKDLEIQIAYYSGFIAFISDFLSGKVKLKDKTEDEFADLLRKYSIPDVYILKVMDSPLRVFSKNKIEELEKKLGTAKDEYDYYCKTTKETEYKKDLQELKKAILKHEKESE